MTTPQSWCLDFRWASVQVQLDKICTPYWLLDVVILAEVTSIRPWFMNLSSLTFHPINTQNYICRFILICIVKFKSCASEISREVTLSLGPAWPSTANRPPATHQIKKNAIWEREIKNVAWHRTMLCIFIWQGCIDFVNEPVGRRTFWEIQAALACYIDDTSLILLHEDLFQSAMLNNKMSFSVICFCQCKLKNFFHSFLLWWSRSMFGRHWPFNVTLSSSQTSIHLENFQPLISSIQ